MILVLIIKLNYILLLIFCNTDWASLLLLRILGFLPSIQGYIHIPTRANDARKGTIFRHVQALILFYGKNSRRPPNGACPPDHFCHHNILDGRSQSNNFELFIHSFHSPLQRLSFTRPRACSGGNGDGPKIR